MPWGEYKRGYLSHEHWSFRFLSVRDFTAYWAQIGVFQMVLPTGDLTGTTLDAR